MADETEGEAIDTPGDDLRDVLGMPPRRAPAVLAPGQIIDDAYRIEEEIGAGGMGRVYRAHDLRLARDVAIKLHAVALAPDDDTLRREGMALARLTHPNVVTVYEVGTWNGHPWVAMEFVPGGTVRTWLRAESRTAQEILALFLAAGRGLAAAHAAGLVHRDFKPDNVLVGDGRVRVADFGLARDASVTDAHVGDLIGSPTSISTKTKTGAVRGTPAYMAPEQRDGTRVDATADQYAFAVSLWESLTGARPFADDGKTVVAPPAGKIPRHAEVALRRAFATSPGERWPSMASLLDELARDPARTRRLIGASLIAIVALVGVGYFAASRRQTEVAGVSCATAGDDIATEWTPAKKDAIRASAGDSSGQVIKIVDRWTNDWRAARKAACEATHVAHTQSLELLQMRETCLDRERTRLSATVVTMATAKLAPLQSLQAVGALPRIEDCGDVTILAGLGPPPTTPADIASSHAAEALIAQSEAFLTAGLYARGVDLARYAVAYTDKLGQASLSARALRQLGVARFTNGEKDGILESYEKCARLAAEAHNDTLLVGCYISALDFVNRNEKTGEVDRLVSVLETAIVRAGNPPLFVERLVTLRADIAFKRAQFAVALPLYQQGLADYEKRFGDTDAEFARYLHSLAATLGQLQRHDEARAALARAIGIMEKLYGTLHPNLGVLITTLGITEYELGRYPEAVADFRRALALKEATLGPDHRGLAPTLINLSLALKDSNQGAEAVTMGVRALAIAEKSLPPNHPKLSVALTALADAQMSTNDWTNAQINLERAVKILEPHGEESPLDEALRLLSKAYLHQKKLPAARATATHALSIASSKLGDSIDTVRTLHALARVQVAERSRDAVATYEKAIAMASKVVGEKHPVTVGLRSDLAALTAQ